MSNNKHQQPLEPDIVYDFDPDEYIPTLIQMQVEYRMATATANLAIVISLILLFMCGCMGALLLTTTVKGGEPAVRSSSYQPN